MTTEQIQIALELAKIIGFSTPRVKPKYIYDGAKFPECNKINVFNLEQIWQLAREWCEKNIEDYAYCALLKHMRLNEYQCQVISATGEIIAYADDTLPTFAIMKCVIGLAKELT